MKKILFFLFLIGFIFSAKSCYAASETDIATTKQEIMVLYNTNRIKEAYQMISNIPEGQRDSEIWLLAANITEDYGRDLDAMALLEKALSVDPTNYKAYYNLGNIQLKGNRYYSAIESYDKCLKIKKDFSYAWYNLGNVYLKLDNYQKAKSAFMRAISFNKTNADFYYNLAYAYKKTGNIKQAEKMLNIYNTLMEQK